MNTATLGRGSVRAGSRTVKQGLVVALLALLAACGSGDEQQQDTGTPASEAESSRFLAQASFGADDNSMHRLSQVSLAFWIEEQFNKPQTLHRLHMDQAAADLAADGGTLSQNNFYQSFWTQAITGEDQLRQRAAFALSQIFVVSYVDGTLSGYPRGVASYYDMLGEKAFGNYRELLEAVTLHPMMGIYLSHLRNRKEEANRVPDENYAREVMQLLSIGLYELNPDGSIAAGNRETYTHDDIVGLARVFTGFSWYAGADPALRTANRFNGVAPNDPARDWKPMQAYSAFHSTSEKKFLGKTIPPGSANAEADLKIALDTLFNHPNVGPFIGKQLIQRMVTSNPSRPYVARVAAAFNNNGSGVRGDMKAVWRAILLDPEARPSAPTAQAGRLREPVLRLANFMRAFKARSQSGDYTGIDSTDNASNSLGQTVMRSPSVFNFYRPGYVPPNTTIASANLVAPELQITHEVSVAGYLNYMRGWFNVNAGRDIQFDFSKEAALATDASALADRMNLLLMGGRMPSATKAAIVRAVNGRAMPAAGSSQANIDTARRERASIAIFLTLASPDYLVQK
jgi:uncharacterized protein (DUF1800 family)